MPLNFRAVKQLPSTVKNATGLALAALMVAIVALFVSLGSVRHA